MNYLVNNHFSLKLHKQYDSTQIIMCNHLIPESYPTKVLSVFCNRFLIKIRHSGRNPILN